MSAIDPVGPAPETRRPSFWWLMVGNCAAPIFWIGQLVLGYGVTSLVCYPGDTPRMAAPGSLLAVLIVFDGIALAAAVAGGAISLAAWRRSRDEGEGGIAHTLHVAQGRTRFLALWGMLSSLWFFFAILFNTIASVLAPLCGE
ncbi:MAG TPA: hypothetical protein VHC39_06000 [Rhizomicrobium sp.]|nr:hypothetical protein [Rhizomicrobium sp.]